MSSKILGFKRNRNDIELENGNKNDDNETESQIYEKMETPNISTDKMSYFLSQIKPLYEVGINYTFSFFENGKKISENIIAICLWGYLPIYEGRIIKFTKKVDIEIISKLSNFCKMENNFEFFSNIQCLFKADNDTLKKLSSLFEEGKYGFIYKGKKDYFLIIHIKSLDKFSYIDKVNDYCQFWIIKIDDKKFLDILGLKPMDILANKLDKEISDYKKMIEQKNSYFQDERREYVDRINKLIKDKEQECEELKNKYNQEIKEKIDLIEKFKTDKMNSVKRVKKFVGLKIISTAGFHIKDETNVISFEEIEKDDKDENEDKTENLKQDMYCILCCIRMRNIFFIRCNHCCICEQCLEKCYHKFNKKTKQDEYFCPICNNETQKDENGSYTEVKKIIFS